MQEKFYIVKDKYTKARGGNSKLLTICCGVCKTEILLYQKDGPGKLLRMYLDKIKAPIEYVDELSKISSKQNMKILSCPSCKEFLAIPMVYKPENRLALRIIGPIKKIENTKVFFPLNNNENFDKIIEKTI